MSSTDRNIDRNTNHNGDKDKDKDEKNKISFVEWLNDRNITFIIISILVVYVIEKFAKNLHNDLVTPAFRKCMAVAGWEIKTTVNHPPWKKLIIHILELFFSIVILYSVSKYVFNHSPAPKSKSKSDVTVSETKRDKPNVFHIYYAPRLQCDHVNDNSYNNFTTY